MSKHIKLRIEQAKSLASCSPCPRGQVGSVIFRPSSWAVVADGYNGPPRNGGYLCGDDVCHRDANQIMSGTMTEVGCHHAEANAIINAAREGASTKGAYLVVTRIPCDACAKLIHHAGITKVFYPETPDYDGQALEYLEHFGIEVEPWT